MPTSQSTHADEDRHYSLERPWITSYPSGVPADIEIPTLTLPDMLAKTRQRFPNQAAATFYGRDYSYREIDEDSTKFANALIGLGVTPGQPVLVVLPNVPQFLVTAYGILKAGAIMAAVNPLLTEHEIRQLADDSGATVVVTHDRFWEAIEPILDDGIVTTAIVTSVQDGLSRIKRWLYPLKYRDEMVDVPHDPSRGRLQYLKLLAGQSKSEPDVKVSPDDVAVFQYTGGTTGLPKAAVLTHRNLIANSFQVRAWLTDTVEARETVMAILPFFHAYGGTLCLYLAINLAAKIVLVPRFDVKDVMELIETHKPTILPGVPTLYAALNRAVENNPARQRALTSIRLCVSGGAPLPLDVRDRFEAVSGARLVEGYGLSEASPVTHVNPLDGRARNGSIGLPLSNTEVRLVDPETKEDVEPGEMGELYVRGPQVMKGYWQRPAETAEILDADSWLHTGDIATMDEDGFFHVVDRIKDVIITGGENIYPTEVELVIASHPKVEEVAVAGVPHAVGGEVAKAYIVLRQGATMDRREVLQYAGERLARYKVPRQVEFREALPKSVAGKVLRRELESSSE